MSVTGAKVAILGERLVCRATYEFRAPLAAIVGSHWSSGERAWDYPVSPYSAYALAQVVGADAFDEKSADLLAEYSRQLEAQRFKYAGCDLDPLPFETKTKPWRHQLAAVRFAEALPAVLWRMGLGTGKTRAAFDWIRLLELERVLVVSPAAVVPNWKAQGAIHAPTINVSALRVGSSMKRARDAASAWKLGTVANPAVVVINYEAAWRAAFASATERARLDAVILDEGHKIKAPSGRASVYFGRLGRAVRRRLMLSGTPFAHSPLDAFAVFRFLDPGIFGRTFYGFRAKYALMGKFPGQVLGYQNMDEFAQRISRITFDVSRDVLDLPPATHVERAFSLPPEASALYRQLAKEFLAEFGEGKIVTTTNSLARLLRLRQVTSGHVGLDLDISTADEHGRVEREIREVHTEKLKLLAEVLEECIGEPIVVFAQFRHDLGQIHRAAKEAGLRSSELSGSRNDLDAWQRGETDVLAVQCQSGSEGIDLTRARYCVIFSLGYSLGQYVQMLARVHRPGQSRPVTYIHLIAEGTVDRVVRRSIEKRQEVIEDVAESARQYSNAMIEDVIASVQQAAAHGVPTSAEEEASDE